jgi:hypothetical protein
VLDCLGFPWILSSESRLFNGLHGMKRGNFFLSPFSMALRGTGTGAAVEALRKHRIVHEASLPKFLILRNTLSSEAFPFSRLAAPHLPPLGGRYSTARRSGAKMVATEGPEILPDTAGGHAFAPASGRALDEASPRLLITTTLIFQCNMGSCFISVSI